MVKLKKDVKSNLINKFIRIKKLFDDEEMHKLLGSNKTINHYLIIHKIKNTNFNTISDIKLIMLCGAFDYVFCAGDYEYNKEQNLAINELNDLIFELRS